MPHNERVIPIRLFYSPRGLDFDASGIESFVSHDFDKFWNVELEISTGDFYSFFQNIHADFVNAYLAFEACFEPKRTEGSCHAGDVDNHFV